MQTATYTSPLGIFVVQFETQSIIKSYFAEETWKRATRKDARVTLQHSSPTSSGSKINIAELVERALQEYFEATIDLCRRFNTELAGTPFQLATWKAIEDIPYGYSVSYQTIAQRLKHPHACRAVANCCHQNQIALFLPCHRVTNARDKTVGYRWDIQRAMCLRELENFQNLRKR